MASDLAVARSPGSPAAVRFRLQDEEGDPADVSLRFRTDSGEPYRDATLDPAGMDPRGVPTDTGELLVLLWDFATDLGGESYHGGIEVELLVDGGASRALLTGVEVGNDVPVIDSSAPAPAGQDEFGGNVDVEFTARDSSGDPLRITVEYNDDAAAGYPAHAWKLARPAGAPLSQPTPEHAVTGLAPDPEGTAATFRWDTAFDLAGFDADVLVRFTPEDEYGPGAPFVTAGFRVDNNSVPRAFLQEGALVASPDERRGIAVPFTLFDEEGDDVHVVLQWREGGEPFPALPDDPGEIEAVLADPLERAARNIVTELPYSVRGRALSIDATSARLPELAGAAATVLRARAGLAGDELEILRAVSEPRPLGLPPNLLAGPVAALPEGDGVSALVLDRMSGGAGWRLREIALATGAVLREIASAHGAQASAMVRERGGAAVLVAEDLGGSWRLRRVELASGTVEDLPGASGAEGPVRGMASVARGAALLTADSSLLRVGYAPPEPSTVSELQACLSEPHGIVRDPMDERRVYVAERSAPGVLAPGRVVAFELDRLADHVVRVEELGIPESGFPRPSALAFDGTGARLLALTDSVAGDGARELRSVVLGGAELGEVFEHAADLEEGARGLAAGHDGLLLVTLGTANEIAAGGGVEQVRRVAAYDPGTLAVTVDEPFDPPLATGSRWRWSTSVAARFRTSSGGAAGFLVWDSGELAGGGQVDLRLTPYDADRGDGATSTVQQTVLTPLAGEPLQLGGLSVPQDVAAGDLNGDGLPDLVVASSGAGGNVSVYFQAGPGAFPETPDLVLTSPQVMSAVAVADLNGDGRLDVIASSVTDSVVVAYLQTAAGDLPPEPDLVIGGEPVIDGPRHLAVADLNGDCLLDVVTSNADGHDLTVFFQSDGGSFPETPDLRLGGQGTTLGPGALVTADLNGDGLLDVASLNLFGDDLTVFYQSAPGLFPAVPDLVLGGPDTTDLPQGLVAADLNGDGRLDLASSSGLAGDVAVFFQSADEGFPQEPDLTISGAPTMVVSNDLEAADLDGDGLCDLAVAVRGADNLAVFFQTAPGEFPDDASAILGGPDTTAAPLALETADLNGDGRLDLVSANSFNGSVSLFLRSGPGRFPDEPTLVAGEDVSLHAAIADLNADGLPDLVATLAGDHDLGIHFQSGGGQFPVSPSLRLNAAPDPFGASGVAAADLTGDGLVDLAGVSSFDDNLFVFHQTSPGSFSAQPDQVLGGPATTPGAFAVAAGDFDGDGRVDLASANTQGDDLALFLRSPAGGFPAEPSRKLGGPSTTVGPTALAAGDLNADGLLDLVSANAFGDDLAVFLQTAAGEWPTTPTATLGNAQTTPSPRSVATEDLNGDGLLDVVSANSLGQDLAVFFQAGPGRFPSAPDVTLSDEPVTTSPAHVTLADLDGDALTDVVAVAGTVLDNVHVFSQTSPGRFEPSPGIVLPDELAGRPRWVGAADLNGDGDTDLVSCGSGRLNVYLAE